MSRKLTLVVLDNYFCDLNHHKRWRPAMLGYCNKCICEENDYHVTAWYCSKNHNKEIYRLTKHLGTLECDYGICYDPKRLNEIKKILAVNNVRFRRKILYPCKRHHEQKRPSYKKSLCITHYRERNCIVRFINSFREEPYLGKVNLTAPGWEGYTSYWV